MLKSIEEHRKVFPEPPFLAFKNFKDNFVRSKLYIEDNGVCDSRGCSPCRKSTFAKLCVELRCSFPQLLIRSTG